MNQSMSMYETTRYVNKTSKKKVVNLIVPSYSTSCTIKLPETLILDKVTDVYLDQVTDLAGETSECFEPPNDLTDGASTSVKRNNRNLGMDGNKEDNAQLMIIKIDELEIKNIAATASVVEKEDEEAMDYWLNNGGPSPRPTDRNPNNLPKFWHKQTGSDGTISYGSNHTNDDSIPNGTYPNSSTQLYLSTLENQTTLFTESGTRPPVDGDNFTSGMGGGTHALPGAKQSYDFAEVVASGGDPEKEILEALKTWYQYTNSRYERYRWFIAASISETHSFDNINYTPTVLIDDTSLLGPPPTSTPDDIEDIVRAREQIYTDVYVSSLIYNALLERYQTFRRAEREWYERVQRYEYSLMASSTINNLNNSAKF